ncbi:MAG: DUF3558 domain-containing protein [Pseudonocardiaceae bacterium]
MASLVMVVGAVVSLAGCTSELKGGSLSMPDAASTATASPISPVRHPRDITALTRRPCDSLTPEQAAMFKFDRPPQQMPGVPGPLACEWANNARDRIHLSARTNEVTLEDVYRKRRSFAFFELTETNGYPMTVSRTNAKLPTCDIDLKPAERQSVSLTYESPGLDHDPQQACVEGKQVMKAVLMNLPPTG